MTWNRDRRAYERERHRERYRRGRQVQKQHREDHVDNLGPENAAILEARILAEQARVERDEAEMLERAKKYGRYRLDVG